MRFKTLSSQSGFSLLQVMIAVGLTSLVSLILAQVASSLTGIQQRARVETELLDRVEDARKGMISTTACMLTMLSSGQPLKNTEPKFPIELQAVYDENKRAILEVGKPISDGFMKVTAITGKLSPSTPDWKASSLVSIDFDLFVELSKVSFGVQSMVKHFSITVETGPSKEFVNCNSVEKDERVALENAICNAIGGTVVNDICDLKKSKSLIQAACESMGLKSNGVHCE